jgi:hypothetical protein
MHVKGTRARLTPEAPTNRNHHKLGVDEGAADGSGDFLRALDAETNVAVVVTDKDKSLEARALACACLLLHRGDLENLVFDRVLKREEGC